MSDERLVAAQERIHALEAENARLTRERNNAVSDWEDIGERLNQRDRDNARLTAERDEARAERDRAHNYVCVAALDKRDLLTKLATLRTKLEGLEQAKRLMLTLPGEWVYAIEADDLAAVLKEGV